MNGLRNLRNRSDLLAKYGFISAITAGVSLVAGLASWVYSLWPLVIVCGATFIWSAVLAIFLWQLWYMSTFFSWTAEAIAQSQEDQTNRMLAALAPEYSDEIISRLPKSRPAVRATANSSSAGGHWSKNSSTSPDPAPVAGNKRLAPPSAVTEATCLSCGRRLNVAGRCPAGC